MASMLRKKVAIVTGASSGIGEAIAIMFASRGAKVTMCGRDPERLNSVFDKVLKSSDGLKNNFLAVEGDINDQNVRKQIVDKTIEKFGRLDILVANAGVTGPRQSILKASEGTYDEIMGTNLKSVFFLLQQSVPHLKKSQGNIINISSVMTTMPMPTSILYSMSKAGLNNLSLALANELGPNGVRVNCVSPAFIPTRIMRQHGEKSELVTATIVQEEQSKQVLRLNDRVLTLEDVAEAVTFLASDSASFITGENIIIDGGRKFTGIISWSARL